MNKWFSAHKKEIAVVAILALCYIIIRSLHFPLAFNFSSEQASFSTKALELFRSHKIELIGPPISWRYEGRYFFQGSITYYVMIPFLIAGKWDPLVSTWLMVPFGALMMVVLYTGARMLIGRRKAFILAFIFSALPFYVDYSRFFWNPTLQFLFMPLVVLFMGLYRKYNNVFFLFLISLTSGVLLLFHYQFILVIAGLAVYYVFIHKAVGMRKLILLLGFPLGFSPWLLFELRNHFYNLQTLLLFLQHANTVFPKGGTGMLGIFTSYYMLSPLMFLLIALLSKISIPLKYITALALLLVWDMVLYFPLPKQAFGMAKNWNYLQEKKTYEIIRNQNITDFNVANLSYDTVAAVQKYFLIRDNIKGNWDDYYRNRYLFLITDNQDYMKNPAYEINTFTPNRVLKTWSLNRGYRLLLLEREI